MNVKSSAYLVSKRGSFCRNAHAENLPLQSCTSSSSTEIKFSDNEN